MSLIPAAKILLQCISPTKQLISLVWLWLSPSASLHAYSQQFSTSYVAVIWIANENLGSMQSRIYKHTQTHRQTHRHTDRHTQTQTHTHTQTCTFKSNLYKPGVGQEMHTLIQNLKDDIIQVSGPIAFIQTHTYRHCYTFL